MNRKVFLAGATGVIGRPLARLLIDAGYEVFGTTRSAAKTAALEAAGVKPIVVDVFDAPALALIMATVQPDIVIHQLTDLSLGFDPAHIEECLARNARIRTEGSTNLVDAALAAGAQRLIAQSIAWAYALGSQPYLERAALDLSADGARAITVSGVAALERLTLHSEPLAGVVLRYGQLYGPRTGNDEAKGSAPLHVDAAALAALLAIERGAPGIYNIAENTGFVSIEKARRELGWDPSFRTQRDKIAGLPN